VIEDEPVLDPRMNDLELARGGGVLVRGSRATSAPLEWWRRPLRVPVKLTQGAIEA
jgi:hypothetical protein